MKGSRILIVEDEPALLRGLKDTFALKGCTVTTAADGEAVLRLALEGETDLILPDIMLPKVNGYEICRTVRECGLEMPIIMLTAKGQEEDIVLGLNLGADDYVPKPFKLGELVARCNASCAGAARGPTRILDSATGNSTGARTSCSGPARK